RPFSCISASSCSRSTTRNLPLLTSSVTNTSWAAAAPPLYHHWLSALFLNSSTAIRGLSLAADAAGASATASSAAATPTDNARFMTILLGGGSPPGLPSILRPKAVSGGAEAHGSLDPCRSPTDGICSSTRYSTCSDHFPTARNTTSTSSSSYTRSTSCGSSRSCMSSRDCSRSSKQTTRQRCSPPSSASSRFSRSWWRRWTSWKP